MKLKQIKDEYARLVYDGQLIEALSKKTADEEQEIDALRTSNLQAKENLANVIRLEFFEEYLNLAQLNAEESKLLFETLTTYPELLKTNEEPLITCLYLMSALESEAPFLRLAVNILNSDAIVLFYKSCENQFVKYHVDEIWSALIYSNLASTEDYNAFNEKVNAEKRRI